MRFNLPLLSVRTKTSARPLLSSPTRFEAVLTNARQDGPVALSPRAAPSSAGENESPLAGWPPIPADANTVAPIFHGLPEDPPLRLTR